MPCRRRRTPGNLEGWRRTEARGGRSSTISAHFARWMPNEALSRESAERVGRAPEGQSPKSLAKWGGGVSAIQGRCELLEACQNLTILTARPRLRAKARVIQWVSLVPRPANRSAGLVES